MNSTPGRRFEVTEWRRGFAQLVEGKPFDVRRDLGFEPGDVLIVREYDDVARVLTNTVAIFRITWVARPSDLQGLVNEGAVVLGLAPANIVASVPAARPEEITSPCCRCGIRTARRLLRKAGPAAAAGEACPFCAPDHPGRPGASGRSCAAAPGGGARRGGPAARAGGRAGPGRR